jgi:transglutaminase-like putative cysteine protease
LIKQKALEIKESSSNDFSFANNIKVWVYKNIKYVDSESMEIKPPEITFLTKEGDCSEDSLLMAKMLNEGGIEAHPIYGSNGVDMHESVEYTVNGVTHRIDEKEIPNFIKHGDGIQSTEYIYNMYWFMGV